VVNFSSPDPVNFSVTENSTRLWSHGKASVIVKAAVRGDDVQVGVEILIIAKGLHRYDRTRAGIIK